VSPRAIPAERGLLRIPTAVPDLRVDGASWTSDGDGNTRVALRVIHGRGRVCALRSPCRSAIHSDCRLNRWPCIRLITLTATRPASSEGGAT